MVQILALILLPFIALMYFITIPLSLLKQVLSQPEAKKKEQMKQWFLKTHILDPLNLSKGEDWFEKLYAQKMQKAIWWKRENLFTLPPLGRDWANGYTPTLDQFTIDLAQHDYQTHYHQLVGRTEEIAQIERILSKSEEANVLIVGDDGVGKHTIVDSFAKKLYEGSVTPMLMYKRILKLDMERILSVSKDQKEREQFLSNLFEEACASGNVILLIDSLHNYLTTDENQINLSAVIEKYGKTSQIQLIGITTPFMQQKYITPNPGLASIFTPIQVTEVQREEALSILLKTSMRYENYYNIRIPYETLDTIVTKSQYYITSIPFPEKAIKLLDNCCVYTVQTLKQRLVTPAIVDDVLTEETHVPTHLTDLMKQKLLQLELLLGSRVLQQPRAVQTIAGTMRRSFIMIGKRTKPLATLLFVGPTGVGKTEMAKALTNAFFGNEQSLVRFDMSLYQSKNDISTLIGSGEKGNPGLLTVAMREHPYGVLLLDEIEKADHDLLNIFLSLLDEGYFTDGAGKRVDCKNIIIIGTSNAGADELFTQYLANKPQDIVPYFVEHHIFSPEFLNRFDGIIPFYPLLTTSILELAKSKLRKIQDELFSLHGIQITVSDAHLQAFINTEYNSAFGARDLERLLQNNIENVVAKLLLEGKAKKGDTIQI